MKKIFTIFMSFVFVFCLSAVSFAAEAHEPVVAEYTYDSVHVEGLPSLIGKWGSERNYFTVFQLKNNDIYYVNYYKHYSSIDNDKYSFVFDGDFTIQHGDNYLYKLEDGNWVYVNQLTIPYTFSNVKQFLYSDRDIKDKSGNVVFPLELSLSQTLIAQTPNLVVKPIMTTLKTLVLCGVGLMALLMLLTVLKKVFYLFQVK